MTIAVIIARGGSRRIPRKNVRPVCGRPLVEWTILQAACSHSVDKVLVSTDDDEIEAIARRNGAAVYRRDPALDNPAERPGNLVFEEVIQETGIAMDDILVTFLPTYCLRKPDDIDNMIEAYISAADNKKYVECFEVSHDIRLCELLENKSVSSMKVVGVNTLLIAACLGMVNTAAVYYELSRGMDAADKDRRTIPYIVEPWQTIDIDHPGDLDIAEYCMYYWILTGKGCPYEAYRDGRTYETRRITHGGS